MISAVARWTPRGDLGRFCEANVSPAAQDATDQAAQMLQLEARALCPVRTGALRDSISILRGQSEKSCWAKVGPTLDYAPYVEFGTGIRGEASPGAGRGPYSRLWPGMVAQPYLRPALEITKGPIRDVFQAQVSTGIREA